MVEHQKIASIILAAGKGTRMGSPNRQKVCFPVDGTPTILRSLRTYSDCGILPHIVVVGYGAMQVLDVIGNAIENVFYTFQTEQNGTGHAARLGAELLQSFNYEDDVLIVDGDKSIEPEFLHRLTSVFYEKKLDLAFVVGDAKNYPTSGRVIRSDNGQPIEIIEIPDIAHFEMFSLLWQKTKDSPLSPDEVLELARERFASEKKMAQALGSIWPIIQRGENVHHQHITEITGGKFPSLKTRNGLELNLDRIQSYQDANLSVYLIRARALYEAINELSSNNVLQEEYLTDIVGILAAKEKYRIETVKVDDPYQVMAFNSQQELRKINDYFLRKQILIPVKEKPSHLHKPTEWLRALDTDSMLQYFDRLYNGNRSTTLYKMERLKNLLNLFTKEYGDEEAIIIRTPGRVNLMGRHIDHQGGYCNLISIDRDIFVVASARQDNLIKMCNLDQLRFPKREVTIKHLLKEKADMNWLDFVSSESIQNTSRKDWFNYILASVLRLQAYFSNHDLCGMNLAVSGDIPVATGLSSSSALVVASAKAVLSLNKLKLDKFKFVELCGEAEWFVGTRGGHADHAAMILGKKGEIVQAGFYPFKINQAYPFPDDHYIVICDSHIKAYKSAESRTLFNQRVACYQLAYLLFKNKFPQYANQIAQLSDINPKNLEVNLAQFYELIGSMPEYLTRVEIEKLLHQSILKEIFSSHQFYHGNYAIRGVMLFGLSECERSRLCPGLLNQRQLTEYGRFMTISHNGDRVVKFDGEWNETPYRFECSNKSIGHLITLALKNEKSAYLHAQPGSYRCSTPEIDMIVDLANSVVGVKGAQLSGAGLGGSVMVLVEESALEDLIRVLSDKYYATRDMESAIAVCVPVAGSGVLEF